MTGEKRRIQRLAAGSVLILGGTALFSGCSGNKDSGPSDATEQGSHTIKTYSDCKKANRWSQTPPQFAGNTLARILQVDVSDLSAGSWGTAKCDEAVRAHDISTGADGIRVHVTGFEHACGAIGVATHDGDAPPADNQSYKQLLVVSPANPAKM